MTLIVKLITACFSLEQLELFKTQMYDSQQQQRQERDELRRQIDELRQEIDDLNRQHAESLEIERTTIISNYDLLIVQLQTKHQQEMEHCRQGE